MKNLDALCGMWGTIRTRDQAGGVISDVDWGKVRKIFGEGRRRSDFILTLIAHPMHQEVLLRAGHGDKRRHRIWRAVPCKPIEIVGRAGRSLEDMVRVIYLSLVLMPLWEDDYAIVTLMCRSTCLPIVHSAYGSGCI